MLFIILLTSCWDSAISSKSSSGAVISGNLVIGHNQKVTFNVKEMDTNRRAALSRCRAAGDEDQLTFEEALSEAYDEAITEILSKITDEKERAEFLENGTLEADVSVGMELTEEEMKSVTRSADGTETIDNNFYKSYQIHGKMTDYLGEVFGDTSLEKTQMSELVTEEFYNNIDETVKASELANFYIASMDYDRVLNLASFCGLTIDEKYFSELCGEIQALSETADEAEEASDTAEARGAARSGEGGGSCPSWFIPSSRGGKIKDGTVLLERGGNKFLQWTGTYTHAGMFSQAEFEESWDGQPYQKSYQSAKCIQTATEPRACLQALNKFGGASKYAGLLPKKWSNSKAIAAGQYNETTFNCSQRNGKGADYCCPWWESFMFWKDTSHNLKSSNAYCSKVAYTGWKKQGINVDGNTRLGNLIHPYEIMASSKDRYIRIATIKWFFGKITIRKKTYSAKTNVIFEE